MIKSSRVLLACLLASVLAGGVMAEPRDTNPLEPGNVIDDIVPQPGSAFDVGIPKDWFDWKDSVYDRIGLRFGFSYQMLGQKASDTLPDAAYDTALGDWWGFLTKWTLLDRGGNHEGTLVFSMFDRGVVGNHAVPSNFGVLEVGSLREC